MTNKLILGTVQLGLDYGINNSKGKPSLESAFSILNTAWDNNIRILDTAEAYGESQEVIGKFHEKFPNKKFAVISKLNPVNINNIQNIETVVLNNLKELKVSNLEAYMFHNFQNFKENHHLFNALLAFKKNGLINKIGVSLHSNKEAEDILNNYPDVNLIQLPFNLLDNHSKRSCLLEKAQSLEVEIHTRSVFLQGLFFKKNNLPSHLNPLRNYLEDIETIKNELGLETQTICLQYALQKPYINKVLIGVDSRAQLLKNIKSIKSSTDINLDKVNKINVLQEELLNPANWK